MHSDCGLRIRGAKGLFSRQVSTFLRMLKLMYLALKLVRLSSFWRTICSTVCWSWLVGTVVATASLVTPNSCMFFA